MEALLECCCGLDIHRDNIEACILKGKGKQAKILRRNFSANATEMEQLTEWLRENDCPAVAMESTGVYWRPVFETLEKYRDFFKDLLVVNAHHMRNLPGRKSDIKDAEWIATLLRHGLLEASFVPERLIRSLREYSRTYKAEVSEKSRYINRIEKFLQSHGFKLSTVLSNIVGQSGLNLLDLLAAQGSLSYTDVIKAVGRRIKKPVEVILEAVCGTLDQSEMVLLTHMLKKYRECEQSITEIVVLMMKCAEVYQKELEIIDSIPGFDKVSALILIAEIGANPFTSFKTAGHLISWAGLSPRNDGSAGVIKSKKILHGNPYIKSILCQIAWVVVRMRNTPFYQWFWSHQTKLGQKKAIIAVSRKLLNLIYLLLTKNCLYDPVIASVHLVNS